MKLDLDAPIRDLEGNPVISPPEKEGGEGRPFLLKHVLISAVAQPHADDPKEPGTAYKLFTLGVTMAQAKEPIDMSTEDLAFLKKRVEKMGFPPLTTGRVWDLLDGRAEPVLAKKATKK